MSDAANAFEMILRLGKVGETYNIPSMDSVRVIDVAKRVIVARNGDKNNWRSNLEQARVI